MTNKNALVSGATAGLGLSIVKKLLENNYKVFAGYRNENRVSNFAELQKEFPGMLIPVELNVVSDESIKSAYAKVYSQVDHIDVLVNNAGAGFAFPVEETNNEDIENIFNVNTISAIKMVRAVLPNMRKNRAGKIVNISSVGGLVGQPLNEIYCAAKFALEGFSESLSSYLEPYFNIFSILIEPGGIKTEFFDKALDEIKDQLTDLDPEYLQVITDYRNTMQERSQNSSNSTFQTPDEVAAIVMNAINSPKPPVRIRTSEWSEEFTKLKTQADPDGRKGSEMVTKNMLNKNV